MTVLSAALLDPLMWDFHLYARQSDVRSVGNASTGMQTEDLPRIVASHFGFSFRTHDKLYAGGKAEHSRVRLYYEQESAVDGNVSFDFAAMARGEGMQVKGFKRDVFAEMLDNVTQQYRESGRMQIICSSLLNRVSRSKVAVVMLQAAASDCDEMLRIWTADAPGSLISPNAQEGDIQLMFGCEVSGKGESRTKRTFVKDARIRIARTQCSCRSLGERLPGFRQYQADEAGNRLSPEQARSMHHWRHEIDPEARAIPEAAFRALVYDNLRPCQIAGVLQRQFGNHPINGTHWTSQQVSWMLDNPLYRGQRRYNRSESVSLARTNRRKRNSADELIYSPHCEHGIQIIPDELFWTAQAKMKEFGYGRRRNENVGRPPDREYLFHASQLLRCALCGHPLRVKKVAKERYLYSCKYLTDTRGLPACQSHDGAALDEYITSELAKNFEAVKALGAEFRRQAKIGKSRDRLAALESRRTKEKVELTVMRENLLKLADAMEADELQANRDLIAQKAQLLKELEQQILNFGNDGMDSASQETLALISAVEAFEASDLRAKRALLKKLFAAVWVWPDEAIWMQWKTDSNADCEQLTGRRLFQAEKWQSLDLQRMEQDTRRLIDAGEIPQAAFHVACGEATVYHFLKGDTYERYTPRTLVRLFKIACAEYVDMARLRTDVEQWVDGKVAEGWTWYRFEKECPVTRATIRKIHKRGSLRRNSLIDMAFTVGGLDRYAVLPDWVYVPPHFDELAAWLAQTGEPVCYDSLGEAEYNSSCT